MNLAPAPATPAPTENLAGLVERVTFHNEENGFCVLRLKARGRRDLVTVVRHAAMIAAGEWVQAAGTWTHDRIHGLQFRANFLEATAPTTIEGIEKDLGSGTIRDIGSAYAQRLVRAFGDAAFDVIEADPPRPREVEGIGPGRAQRIAASWAEQKVVREIMLFPHAHVVGTSRAALIETGAPDPWVHGHVHRHAEYRVGRTRIVCNARGHVDEVMGFEPDLVVGIAG